MKFLCPVASLCSIKLALYKFAADEEVDGSTLWMLGTSGSSEQLKRCGLKTLKEEMKLKRMILEMGTSSKPSQQIVSSCASTADRKLKSSEMKQLVPEEKRTYLIK